MGGRHVGIGHGIFHSQDGGKTWKNKGLKKSEHLSKIIIHPKTPILYGLLLKDHYGVRGETEVYLNR